MEWPNSYLSQCLFWQRLRCNYFYLVWQTSGTLAFYWSILTSIKSVFIHHKQNLQFNHMHSMFTELLIMWLRVVFKVQVWLKLGLQKGSRKSLICDHSLHVCGYKLGWMLKTIELPSFLTFISISPWLWFNFLFSTRLLNDLTLAVAFQKKLFLISNQLINNAVHCLTANLFRMYPTSLRMSPNIGSRFPAAPTKIRR